MMRKTVQETTKFVIHADGGSRGNPGKSAIGVVIEDARGRVVERIARRISDGTNNEAEYKAAIAGVEHAAMLGAQEVVLMCDSELMARQITGEYRVKARNLALLRAVLMHTLARIPKWSVKHVPREMNAEADALLNYVLDQQD